MPFLPLEGKIAKMESETCHTSSTPTDTFVTSTHILLVKVKSHREAQSQWDWDICFSCWQSMAKGVDKEATRDKEQLGKTLYLTKRWNRFVKKF